MVANHDVGEMFEFKLQLPVVTDSASSSGGGVEETLCGYVARNLEGSLWLDYRPVRFYRLVYRRGKNVSGGTSQPHDDDVITDVEAQREERRLMATKESSQRYSLL